MSYEPIILTVKRAQAQVEQEGAASPTLTPGFSSFAQFHQLCNTTVVLPGEIYTRSGDRTRRGRAALDLYCHSSWRQRAFSLLLLLHSRDKEKARGPIHWFTSQLPERIRNGPGQNQELNIKSGCSSALSHLICYHCLSESTLTRDQNQEGRI